MLLSGSKKITDIVIAVATLPDHHIQVSRSLQNQGPWPTLKQLVWETMAKVGYPVQGLVAIAGLHTGGGGAF